MCTQENSQIRELQQDNRDLRVALEEHQSALELIMKKYREQVAKLLAANRLDRALVTQPPELAKVCDSFAVNKLRNSYENTKYIMLACMQNLQSYGTHIIRVL